MAKQTFTTGQVLTAAQMTSLQQTAMVGGAASAKTASYTLVAADAGTAITMSNASATTITVNTALFAAGDTVQITNIGAGVCTITAGTATVNTSASLALAQYESGTLKFTSASAAIFIKGAGAAAASGGMTLLSTTTLSGATTNITSIDQTYNSLFIVVDQVTISADSRLVIQPNSASGVYAVGFGNASTTAIALTNGDLQLTGSTSNVVKGTGANNAFSLTIDNYASTTNYKPIRWFGTYENATTTVSVNFAGGIALDSAVSSLLFFPVGTFNGGTVRIYGVK